MKIWSIAIGWIRLVVVLALGWGADRAAGSPFSIGHRSASDTRTTVALRADGSCVLTNETLQPRKALEVQVLTWERFSQMEDELDEDVSGLLSRAVTNNPLSDEELSAKLRAMHLRQAEESDSPEEKVSAIEITTNSVRVVTTRTFASLQELLAQGPYAWTPAPLNVQNVQAEIDTNQQLRITFIPARNPGRYARTLRTAWRFEKFKLDWKLMLPGKILSSGFPSTEGNTTGLTLNGAKAEELDSLMKLSGAPIVVTAEPAGIKLDQLLDSKKLAQAAASTSKAEPDLPITEATAGFLAEPVSITLSTVYYFPGHTRTNEDSEEIGMWSPDSPGTVVAAKLFPPRGRQLRGLSELRVKSAKDDKGRSVPLSGESMELETAYNYFRFNRPDDSEGDGPTRIQLRLGLPAPDAKTIEEIEAEGVALTIGGWNELVVTNIQADPKQEIDLSQVLPGAKLSITRLTRRQEQTSVQARLEGPPAVNQIEVKIKSSRPDFSSDSSEQKKETAGGKTVRTLMLRSYEFESRATAKESPVTLVVRYPKDMKRERVRFKLTALDLL